jgi:hypothetical protein
MTTHRYTTAIVGPSQPVAESIRLQLGTDALVLITPGPHSCAAAISSVPGYPSRLTDVRTELDRDSVTAGAGGNTCCLGWGFGGFRWSEGGREPRTASRGLTTHVYSSA